MINISLLCKSQELKIRERLLESENNLMRMLIQTDQGYTPLNLGSDNFVSVKDLGSWENKVLHGKIPTLLNDEIVDKNADEWILVPANWGLFNGYSGSGNNNKKL